MNKKKIWLITFWIFLIISFECIYRMTIFKNIIDSDFFQMIIFCLPVAVLLYFLTTLFKKEKINKIITTIVILLLYFVFFAQMVYFQTYKSVFSIYSMTNGGQVLEFWRAILSTIMGSIYNYICITIPVVLYFILIRIFDFSRNTFKVRNVNFCIFLGLQIICFSFIFCDTKSIYSSYNLNFNTHAPILSTKKFGLIRTMKIDLQRCVFGMAENEVEIIISKQEKDNSIDEKKYDYNNLDIDFDTLIENEKNDNISMLHKYFNSVSGTKQNEYTGMFEGKNIVFFLAESLDPIAISEELTPTLYKLSRSGFNFTNYYTPLYPASTADGEFRTEWSIISSRGDTLTLYAAKDTYSPYLFVNTFKDYNKYIYHDYNGDYYNRRTYFKSLGYENFKSCFYGLDLPCDSFHQSDLDMVNLTFDEYLDDEEPFFAYYITLSGHLSYSKSNNAMSRKNWDYVDELPYSDKVKSYIATNIEVDKALESLIEKLEVAGKLDDTVIVITPDHYPYGLSNENINEISEFNRDDDFELYHSDLIIWNSEMKDTITIDKVGSNPDVLPTILNLFGIKYDSRMIMGQDLLSDNEGLVVLANRSWITNKLKYNSLTTEVTKFDGSELEDYEIDQEYVNTYNTIVDNQFKISNLILKNNYYKKIQNQYNTALDKANSVVDESNDNTNETEKID